ncbi:MAG: DUF308 domain-containing protein [Anaerolineales bacterium]|nr:DUF308 domain-containing protein [Anaerolineales bacterium]
MSSASGSMQTQKWWLVLLEGSALLIAGLLLLTGTRATRETMIQIFGLFTIAIGLLSFVQIFTGDPAVGKGWYFLKGILAVLAGWFIFSNTILIGTVAPFTLAIVLATATVIYGGIKIYAGVKGAGWGATILGVLLIVVGFGMLTSVLVVTIFMPMITALVAVFGGGYLVYHSFQLRSQEAQQ